ncbi:hypothetical protein ACFSBZ_00165 [Amnibacterium flavum]|uniref:Uncharacterized protein n=1 Tax=Amnibacterium flavum TaxID=2173173 RepID=A0A2V1HZL9_9MICO|nr:hypothetical protein [Amnibacterium flavum]PVZ96254.1 hypothetical protein DDQ50_07535 [Amnibacterium flavum]
MARTARAIAVLGAVALSVSLLTACTEPAPERESPLIAARERAATEVDAQIAGIASAGVDLDRLLLVDSGLAEAAGVDGSALFESLHAVTPAAAPTTGSSSAEPASRQSEEGLSVSTALAASTSGSAHRTTSTAGAGAPNAAEAANAAANGLSLAVDSIRDALGAAAQDDDSLAEFDSGDGTNPQIGWTVAGGAASGTVTSTISDTGPDGTRFEMITEGEYHVLVCPAADGAIEGGIWVRSAITVTPPGGTPQRSVIELNIDLGGTSNDEAYAADSWADGTAGLSQGTPGPGPADLATKSTSSETAVESTFVYSEGAKEVRDVALDDPDGTNLTTIADDLTMQMQQVLVRMAEDYWRGGNCVRALVTPEANAIDTGDSTGISVRAESIVDGTELTAGRSEWTGIVAIAGSVTPTEPQKLPGAFVFESADEKGWANPEFMVTTRRGIGANVAPIQVGGTGLVFTGTYGGGVYRGYSCDGIKGPWTMSVFVPEIGEGWSTRMTFDDALTSGYDDEGTGNAGPWAHPDALYWFTPDGEGYVFHADPYDPSFPVSEAPVEECTG